MSAHVINRDANYISVLTLSNIETWPRCIEADEAFVCDNNAARLDAHECLVEVDKENSSHLDRRVDIIRRKEECFSM